MWGVEAGGVGPHVVQTRLHHMHMLKALRRMLGTGRGRQAPAGAESRTAVARRT